MSEGSKQNFLKGAAILGAAGLIVKLIGAVYRILLFNVLTSGGMAYYEVAYPFYSFLLVISSAGLPTAISKLVSERVAVDDYRGAHKTFQTAYKLLAIIGVVTMVLLLILAKPYANFVKTENAVFAILAIAPSLFFVSVISAYRGYFQGLNMMTPTAVSQLIEQVGKFVFGYGLALYFVPKGLHFGAMGALLGVSISEFLAMIMLVINYNKKKAGIKMGMRMHPQTRRESKKDMMLKIIYVALPITVGASIMPLSLILDTVIIKNRLLSAGLTNDLAHKLYGIYAGNIMSVINMPAVISVALGMALVPAISGAIAKQDKLAARKTAGIGVKISLLFGLPAVIGMYLAAEPVLKLLFRSMPANEMIVAVGLLQIMSIAVLFLTIVQTMSSVIQGFGKYMIPVFSLCVGAIAKVIVSYILVGNPNVNINGAAWGTLVCYGISGMINLVVVFRLAKIRFSVLDYVIRPLVSTGIMGVVVYFLLPIFIKLAGNSIGLIVTITIAMLVYMVMIFATGALKEEDMEFVPGGSKLTKILYKTHLWKEKR